MKFVFVLNIAVLEKSGRIKMDKSTCKFIVLDKACNRGL